MSDDNARQQLIQAQQLNAFVAAGIRLRNSEAIEALGRRRVRLTFDIDATQDRQLHDLTVDAFTGWAQAALNHARTLSANPNRYRYKITFLRPALEFVDTEGDVGISTTFLDDPMAGLEEKLNSLLGRYDDDDFVREFNELIVEVVQMPQEISGRSGKRFVMFYKDAVLISPQSQINCGFTSVAISANFRLQDSGFGLLIYKDKQNESGRMLKKRAGCTGVESVDDAVLQKVCQYMNRRIEVYDSKFRVLKAFAPVLDKHAEEPARIYFHQGHYWALLFEHELEQYQPRALTRLRNQWGKQTAATPAQVLQLEKRMHSSQYREYCIKKPENKMPPPEKIYAADIEAFVENGEFVPYAMGFSYAEAEVEGDDMDNWLLKHEQWVGLDCCREFLDHLHERRDDLDGGTIYFHNGGKFDMQILFKYALCKHTHWRIRSSRFIVQNGAIIQCQIYCKREQEAAEECDGDDPEVTQEPSSSDYLEDIEQDKRFHARYCCITFLDSIRVLTGSLDQLTRDFNVRHKKLQGAVDHASVTRDNFRDIPFLRNYLTNDCHGLLEMMIMFARQVWDKKQINVTRCLTGATLAKKNFYLNYYDPQLYPIYHLKGPHDAYVRSGYFGGRVEAYRMGVVGAADLSKRIYSYDVTSEYPHVGRLKLPFGKPVPLLGEKAKGVIPQGSDRCHPQFFGFVRVKVRGPFQLQRHQIPVHGCIQDMKLMFPVFEEPRELVLFSEQINFAAGRGYTYEVVDALQFRGAPYLKKCFEDAFEGKNQAAREGKLGLKASEKIVANSTYGQFALNVYDRDQVLIKQVKDPNLGKLLDQKICAGTVKSWAEYGTYGLVRSEEELGIKDFNVAIGAAITSWARMYIQRAIEDFKERGAEVYYTDTDSLKTNLPMGKHPDLLAKYFWDGEGKELGTLKNECEEEMKSHVTHWVKKLWPERDLKATVAEVLRVELEAEPHGEFSFDQLIVCGCKNYALRRRFLVYDLPPLEMFTLKGLRKNAKVHAYARSDAPLIEHDRSCCPLHQQQPCDLCARIDCPYHDPEHYTGMPQMECPSCCGERDQPEIEVNVSNFDLMCKTSWTEYPDGGMDLAFEHYEILANGGLIKQDQEQFRSGTAALLNEQQRGGSRIIRLPKQVRSAYSKGIVSDNGWTTPLRLTAVDYARQAKHTPDRYLGISINPADEPDAPQKRTSVAAAASSATDSGSDADDEDDDDEPRSKRQRLSDVGGLDAFLDDCCDEDGDDC